MTNTILEKQKIEAFLKILQTTGGLDFNFEISACNGQVQTESSAPSRPPADPASPTPHLCVELSGPDTPLLLHRNAELLHAIEHLAAKVIRLEPEQHDQIYFDAANFKVQRERELRLGADTAIESVRATGRPYAFPPMNSRERRLLHLLLSESGLPTASSGDIPRRFVVLYPLDYQPNAAPASTASPAASADRTHAVRNTFRRR
jgi:spoIIIJ-associated protein